MIRVLYFEGCPNHKAALVLAEEVAAHADRPVPVEAVEVTTLEQAEALRFLGSPTVQVDGRDIEEGVDGARTVEFACRVYRTEAGVAGIPPRAWLEEALRRKGIAVVSTGDRGGCCET